VLKHVERILNGHDSDLVGSIAASILLNVILADVPSHDVTAINRYIDDIAAFKAAAREQLERDKWEGFQ